ncbi:MAG TPA: thiamine pyrophosphate-binding protein [Vicinamibacterales bacterium]|nr:thiamine pyrophosphate-binding protein [Vicinamibacterales bacterium]
MTVAELLVAGLKGAGTRAIFGMPGGGSNLDVIDAARRAGLRFVLSQTETGGALMAAAQAEITGAPGACLCTLGPGVSSIVNGVAHAFLDRVPLVVMTDAIESGPARFEHQRLPHDALLASITKASMALTAERPDSVQAAIELATSHPAGPVHFDCAAPAMSADVSLTAVADGLRQRLEKAVGARTAPEPPQPSERACQLLRDARRPVLIAGLDARPPGCAAALGALCGRRVFPVFATYKAKGAIADDHPSYAGLFTLGEIERPLIERADLIITAGLDAVELLPRVSRYRQPFIHCAASYPEGQFPPGDHLSMPLTHALEAIDAHLNAALEWNAADIARHRDAQRAAVMMAGEGLSPGEAVTIVAEATRAARHVTVDAGAHMFPAMTLLPADRPGRILISNGLSTMGFALPAAIGAALLAPDDPVVALTGDAGLLMCVGELRTAVREQLRVIVVVMADDELSLIRIKQDRRGLPSQGVRLGEMDWPGLARAMGCPGASASSPDELARAMAAAMDRPGPSLVEARIDPSGYSRMLQAIRG